jgi:hypothetical protein
MSEFWHVLAHGICTGLPFGLLLGLAFAWIRLSAVDYRQWFRDPAQPMAYGDDSWIGLLLHDVRIVSLAALALVVSIALLARQHTHGELLADVAGIILGAAPAQFLCEVAWRFGLHVVPDALPATRLLSTAPIPRKPDLLRRPGGHRRLVVCCDGTWNWPDQEHETNVVRLLRAIEPQAQHGAGAAIAQITHYHLGVGTGNILDRVVGGAVGIGLSNSVKACYGFLVDNYAPGDEIHLFGFSRGAYVARSVAGMIGRIGLLQRWEMERFMQVWDWYVQPRNKRREEDLDRLAPKRQRDVDIECIGVWDTVGALGIPGTRFCAQSFAFHETELGERVRHAFQALAIDERRGNFQAAAWSANPQPKTGQVLEQAWFPGVHSNVGGGYERHGLSDTTFLWMLSRIQRYGLLALDTTHLAGALDGSEPYPDGALEDSRTPFWRLIGSPCPRPVGLTSPTEHIHESAWKRAASSAASLAKDIYHKEGRKRWLQSMTPLELARSPFEQQHAVTVARAQPSAPPRVSQRIGLCDSIMKWLVGNS